MKSKKNWYEQYNYDLMSQELDRRIAEDPNFTIDRNIEMLQICIDCEIIEWEKFGDFDEDDLASYIKTKEFWVFYNRERTIRQIIES
jgi:hypothetical protein